MYGYIYITTNNLSGKQYIGRKTSSVFVESYLGSGIHLNRAIKKYGKINFSVKMICECYSYHDLVEREAYYIKLYDAVKSDKYYNSSYGGYNEGFDSGENNIAKRADVRKINSEKHRGKRMSEEFKKIQSEIHRGKPSGMKGKFHSESTKQRISESSKQQKHTAQRDSQVSNHHTGSKMMTNGAEQRWVYKEDMDCMLAAGGGLWIV